MKGDLHYELVLEASGRAHVYFTDAVREDLPASIASEVTLTIKSPGKSDELVRMHIDEAGESWVGTAQPIPDPAATTVRVAFTIHQEPYWIDVPYK